MSSKHDVSPEPQRFTYADYLDFPDDGQRTLEQFVLEREELIPVAAWRPGQRVLARALSGFEIDVASVFENLDPV